MKSILLLIGLLAGMVSCDTYQSKKFHENLQGSWTAVEAIEANGTVHTINEPTLITDNMLYGMWQESYVVIESGKKTGTLEMDFGSTTILIFVEFSDPDDMTFTFEDNTSVRLIK